MVHKPTKKELKQMENLNKAYTNIKNGLKLIEKNVIKDNDLSVHVYRMNKEFDKIIARVSYLLEKQYVDSEFTSIIKFSSKKSGKRFNKGVNKKTSKRKKK